MRANTARRRALEYATKHRARFGAPAQRFHCTDDHMAGAAAQLRVAIKLVKKLRDEYRLEGKWRTLHRAVEVLRRLQDG